MKVNKDENIIMTLQLVKSDGVSVEEDATVAYKILDHTATVEVVSEQSTTFNDTTKSYLNTLNPSASWTTQDVGSYIVVWSVSGTDDDFNDTYTDNLEVGIDKKKIDRILALVHENIYIDNTQFDTDDNLFSSRLRIYENSVDVGTDSGVIATYQITAVTTGPGKFSSWKQVKE